MRKIQITSMVTMVLVAMIMTGCVGNDSIENGGVAETYVYEEKISNLSISDRVEASIWTGTGSLSVDASGVVLGYPSAEVSRPEHLHKALINVTWQTSTQDIFEEARVAAGPSPSFNNPWVTDSGSGPLHIEVDKHQWAKGDMLLEFYPGANADSQSLQFELHVVFDITLIEHVPIMPPEEISDEDRGGRGSNEP